MNTEIENNLLNYLIRGVKDYAIFALDTNGIIASWNIGAERAKGYKAGEIIGKHFSTFYLPEDKASKHPEFELEEALKHGSYEEEGWRVRKDGSHFWAHVTITALFDDNGKHIGFAKVTRDLTEKRKWVANATEQTKQLKESEEAFKHIIRSVKDYAIFMLSPEGIIRTWNSGAEKIKGYSAEEIIGQHFSKFYTEEDKARNHPEFELRSAIQNGSYEEEGWRLRKNGSQFWASVTITPVVENENVTGFVKVTRDLTERKVFESQLKVARDEAILANQLKTKLVANITHEIRTPLGGIIGLSELISNDPNSSDDIQDSGKKIFQASRNLLGLLNDLLDFAKLEAGKVTVEETSFSIKELLDEVTGLTDPSAVSKGLKLTTSVDLALPTEIFCDRSKVRQVLLNLVQNSLKFTTVGGVDISVEAHENDVVFSVTDTGIGVNENVRTILFKPFTQGHDSTYGGTGLGLSICQQYIELMGGTVEMFSEPGKGTCVCFSLPLKGESGE